MKVTIIGGACLFIETGSETIYGASTGISDAGLRLSAPPPFQYGPDDSALLVARDGIVPADLNDCKISGAAAKPMLRTFGQPAFVFESHSFAQAYPNFYNAADPAEAQLMTREDLFERFTETLRELRPPGGGGGSSGTGYRHGLHDPRRFLELGDRFCPPAQRLL